MLVPVSRICLNAALGLGITLTSSTLLAVELTGDAYVVASDQTELDSVLVANRLATDEEAKRSGNVSLLEPISTVSDFEPELAEPPKSAAEARVALLPKKNTSSVKTDNGQAKFHGVQVGSTSLEELLSSWGEPASRHSLENNEVIATDGELPPASEVLRFEMDNFASVETLVNDEIVQVVRVTLESPASVEALLDTLAMQEFESVDIIDPQTGELLAVTVPEKGLTLLTEQTDAPVAGNVTHLVLQALDTQAFALRAEMRGPTYSTKSLADLDRALLLDSKNAHAHWLKADLLRMTGQAIEAEAAAAKAVELDAANSTYLLLWAQTLADLDRHDEAVLKTRQVIDKTTTEAVRAEALHTMGLLAALGDSTITEKAINFHSTAIRLADKIATSNDDLERRAAKDLLIRSHLAIANLIAERDYPDKTETVAQWIGRASGLAEECIQNDGGGLELRLMVAREALGALASLRPALDPKPWVQEAEATAATLRDEVSDSLFLAKIEWDLGLVHQRAVRIEHARGNAEKALSHGSKAIEHLSAGAESRVTLPSAEQTVSELYFYLGAVNAVHLSDHKEAVGWYNKARPLFESSSPESDFRIERKMGEKFVSMAVSYWEMNQADLALELTSDGANYMSKAVEAGVLRKSALQVPYGNLRTMHLKLDNSAAAKRYEKLYVSYGGKLNSKATARKSSKDSKTARSSKNSNRTARLGRPTMRGTMTR